MAQGNYEALAPVTTSTSACVPQTGEHAQLVVMTLAAGEGDGEEMQEGDQILFFVEGDGKVDLGGQSSLIRSS